MKYFIDMDNGEGYKEKTLEELSELNEKLDASTMEYLTLIDVDVQKKEMYFLFQEFEC